MRFGSTPSTAFSTSAPFTCWPNCAIASTSRPRTLGRQAWIIAESDLNDVRVLNSRAIGGLGIDAQWHDEFHHALYGYLTGANQSYMAGFDRLGQIQKAITEGFVHDGCYSAISQAAFRQFVAGPARIAVSWRSTRITIRSPIPASGSRLSRLVSPDQYKLAAALLLCSPFLPLLFMGEEFADTAPFQFFTSFGDPALARAVSEGRWKEFEELTAADDFADPQSAGDVRRIKDHMEPARPS